MSSVCEVSREGSFAPERRRRTCPACASPVIHSARAHYCSRACQQRAYRLRLESPAVVQVGELRNQLRAGRALTAQTVYECGACGERYLGEQRCDDCNRMCRKLGLGGTCPACDDIVLVDELLGLAS